MGERIVSDKKVFACLFSFVWFVSMIDHYLAIKLSETLHQEERNPLGLLLLELDGGNPALFMTIKMAGLWIIFFSTILLYKWRKIYGLIALQMLALIQLYLLMYFIKIPQ